MALITDPDLLSTTEVTFDAPNKTIQLNIAGNLSTDGVTLQCLYSYCKEEWKSGIGDNVNLIKYPFPILAITEEKFELISSWDFLNDSSRQLIRTGGWALNPAGTVQEEYAGVITLGSVGTGQVYYQQETAGSTTNVVLTGAVNQAIKTYGDATHGNFDYRAFLKLFCREYAKSYASVAISDIGVSAMTYQVYRFPLANADDLKIIDIDGDVDSLEPYISMDIEWFGSDQPRTIGVTEYQFRVIVEGASATLAEIYTFVQRQLRKATDIDAGAGSVIGKTCPPLLNFVGDTLYTLLYSTGNGTYIDNHQIAERPNLKPTDNTGTVRSYPTVSIVTLNFGSNLVADSNASFWVFFTNDDAGDNLGYDYGTANAIIVQSTDKFATTFRARTSNVATITTSTAHGLAIGDGVNVAAVGGTGYNGNFFVASVPDTTHFTYSNTAGDETETADTGGTITRLMAGKVGGASSEQFGYDYTYNVQRGTGSDGTNAPITTVSLGLSTAQFVSTTNTITTDPTAVSLVSPLERNYSNP